MTTMLTRRGLLQASFVAVAGAGLASCSSGSQSSSSGADPAALEAALPEYRPFPDVATPDLHGTPGGALDAFLNYPADPRSVYDGVPGDGDPITGLAQLNTSLPPALEQNEYWQALNERVGSPMQIQLVNAGDDFSAKIATMSAGDDFPDMMQVNGSIPALAQFLDAKMLDLTPYLAGDAILDYPALANIPTQFWEPCVFNGKLLALPISRGVNSSFIFYYRSDILADAGTDAEIANWDDLVERAEAATDPRQNRWGFGSLPAGLARQMLNIPNGWHEVDGELVHSIEDERQTEALEAVRQLQEQGLMNPDLAGAPPSQQQQWFGAGQSAFYGGTYSAFGSLVSNFGVPADALEILPIVGFDGGQGAGWMGTLNNNITAIPATAQGRAETLLKVANYLASPFGSEEYLFIMRGIEGRHYELEGTNPIPVPEVAPELGLGVGYLSAPPPVLYNPAIPGYAEKVHASQTEFAKTATVDLGQRFYSEAASRRGAQLDTAQNNAELDIIYGRAPVSSWGDFVASWRADGGDQIREELTVARDAAQ